VVTSEPVVTIADFQQATGWELKPEGACRGNECVPLPRPVSGAVDLREIHAALRMPLVHDAAAGLWVLGPPAGAVLDSAVAPDVTLPERQGGDFTLSSLRGRKIAVVAWAPW
jgi:hypothetical protein